VWVLFLGRLVALLVVVLLEKVVSLQEAVKLAVGFPLLQERLEEA